MTRRIGTEVEDETIEHIVDFNKARELRLLTKRRNTERIFFKNLMAVYSVVGQNKICPVDLIEVSEEGCSFQVPCEKVESTAIVDGVMNITEYLKVKASEIPLRFYFSQDSYLEIFIRIQNSSYSIENGAKYLRYGCTVDKTLKSYTAYQQFVKFLKLYSEYAHKDISRTSVVFT